MPVLSKLLVSKILSRTCMAASAALEIGRPDPLAVLDEPLDWADCLRKANPEDAEALLGLLDALRQPGFRQAVQAWVLHHCGPFQPDGNDEHRLELSCRPACAEGPGLC